LMKSENNNNFMKSEVINNFNKNIIIKFIFHKNEENAITE